VTLLQFLGLGLRHSSSLRLSLFSLLTNTLPGPSASEITTLRRYTNLFIIIIIYIIINATASAADSHGPTLVPAGEYDGMTCAAAIRTVAAITATAVHTVLHIALPLCLVYFARRCDYGKQRIYIKLSTSLFK